MFSLYLHIPFCRRKCPYCDFFSVSGFAEGELAAYPGLLLRQLALATGWDGPISSIFFGGGTPSLLPAAAVARVLSAAEARFGFAPQIEISLEGNPGTLTPAYLAALRRAGVNRLSLGVQAALDTDLQRLGRIHTHAESVAAVAAARAAGFDNLSLDLIYGRPGQGAEALAEEVAAFLALDPEHLSCYALTVEESTPFAAQQSAGELVLPEEELVAGHFLALHQQLNAAGYRHYEISNYARPGRECVHNLGYWQRRSSLGLGAGAHSFRAEGWGERRSTAGDLDRYRRELADGRDPATVLERFDRAGAMAEILYLGLRTADGVDDADFRRQFGVGVAEAFPAGVARCADHLQLIDGAWRFDVAGWLLYDYWIENFL